MQTLHLDLKTIKGDVVALRCFWDNPNDYVDRPLSLSAIAALTRTAEETYYVSARTQVDLATTGQALFNWLDGNDRWLVSRLGQYPGEVIVLAIAVAEGLAHLPWEVLHDGAQFLVQRYPAVVPVRWLSSDQMTQLALVSEPQNRALRVLFMATSPRSVEPVLDYEQEEAAILKATARPSIGLVVEESGCLEELGYLADSYGVDDAGKRYFDVVHVTGHATIEEGQPRFITETATGDAHYASAIEIARTLKTPLPPLLFLSGCRTGQAGNAGAVPSMAEQLLQAGATAVLGWGQNVLDTDATSAAAALYEALARSNSLAEAVAFAYQKLIEQQARDWHLLRLYVAKTLPGQLVKPAHTPGWQRAPRPSIATEFLDPLTQTIKVPTRESFVGRRRQLQNCLRSLTQSPDHIGVLIHGMGGLGKSSLAARLCDRLPQFNRLVWSGRIDPANLVQKLAEAVDDANLRQRLIGQDEELKFRLRGVFIQLQTQGALPFLLILDDFEENLEARGTGYVLKTPAAAVLGALIWAIQDSDPRHRLILTSCYDFEMQSATVLYRQPMDALQGADLRKKCERLSALKLPELPPDAAEDAKQAALAIWQLQEQAKQLADGNPRLLETLNDTVLAPANIDKVATLARLAADPTDLRQKVLEDRVLQQMDADLQGMLSRGLIFELPVPKEAFATVTLPTPPTSPTSPALFTSYPLIDCAVALGLLEASPDDTLRVPRILPLAMPTLVESLYSLAAQSLYSLWWSEDASEIQALEIIRLGKLANNGEIAVTVGDVIANRWYINALVDEAEKLCLDLIELFDHPRVLSTLARIYSFRGRVEPSIKNYERAVSLYRQDNISERVDSLATQAVQYAQQGKLEEGLKSWEDGIETPQKICNAQSQAAKMSYIAIKLAEEGNVDQSIEVFQQVVVLYKQVGDLQSPFTILSDISRLIAQTSKRSIPETENQQLPVKDSEI